ncbi:MAG TPA: DUF1993 domain-containing protein [Phenylobacterium sp.]
MAVNLFTFAGMYERVVGTAEHLLAQGVAFAKANGVSEADMLEWRLIDDMFPLRNQFQTVANFPRQFMARATGQDVPEAMAGESTVAELQAALAETKAYLAKLTPAQFEGRDDIPLTVNLGQMEPTFPTGQWITSFATTNLYFHLSTAYGILRSKGVQIGKRDLFAGGL